jgi:hypothetical protein
MVTGYGGVMRDSTNIYARASWPWWSGGRILSNRQMGTSENIIVSNYRAEDPLPTLNVFTIDFRDDPTQPNNKTFRNVLFEDIFIANVSTIRNSKTGGDCVPKCGNGPLPTGIPNTIIGGNESSQNVSNVAFNRVSIAGVPLGQVLKESPGLFNVSGSVFNVTIDGTLLTLAPAKES